MRTLPRRSVVLVLVGLLALASRVDAFSVVEGTGAVGTQTAVDNFRAILGDPNNASLPGPLPTGRREINWDGGGNQNGSPGGTPFAVFQNRGLILTTPGSGFQQAPIAAGVGNLSDVFGIDYSTTFQFFSQVRLFVPVDSNVTEGRFSVAGTNGAIPAGTRAFGAVFTDVDLEDETTIELFGPGGVPLASVAVPAAPGDGELSFLGIVLDPSEGVATRLRIITGNAALGVADGPGIDIVAMDDFLFAETVPVPLPGALVLIGAGLLVLSAAGLRLRRRPTR
jgi:hypothetical protein